MKSTFAGYRGMPQTLFLRGTGERRVVLDQCGVIDPESIGDYRSAGGYTALEQALTQNSPDTVRAEITTSGLRGRGGGGYPTGTKWQHVASATGRRKIIIANGDEGDPGAFMDRTLMEYNPHLLVEGMAIAAYAVGASQGFVYVRAEYPLAAQRISRAIEQAERAGLLGRNIMGSDFSCTVQLRRGAGAFVCGEETALMASIRGQRGQPVIRPPYPAQHGLKGQPTLINNVETFCTVPAIIRNGSGWFATMGTPGNRGTKVFSISGDVAQVGVVEVELGTPLRTLLELAGGVTGGDFKAAQTGGAGGGCIPASHLDLPLEYESLHQIGSMMGSGGLIVLNQHRCMVDLARYFMGFSQDESCGKCTPCRCGTQQAHGLLTAICRGEGTVEDLDQLAELAHLMQESSLCGLGAGAASPVLSTLRWFRDEYEAHIRDRICPAGVCPLNGGRPCASR